jgi:hypothetical protein
MSRYSVTKVCESFARAVLRVSQLARTLVLNLTSRDTRQVSLEAEWGGFVTE